MTARLLMIALDAADSGLLRRWMDEGELPRLARLRARGQLRPLTAPTGAGDDALWGSFRTGQPLGEHGEYHYKLTLPNGKLGMAFTVASAEQAFWHGLSEQGLRVALLDVPKGPAPRPLNGIQLADWLVHGRVFREPRSFPEALAAETVARFGAAPPSRCDYHQPLLPDRELAEIADNLRLSAARKRAAALHHLTAEPWDLFLAVFKEAHCGGHAFWNLVDPRHAEYAPDRDAALNRPLLRIFQDLDSAVGDLVAAAGPGAEVVVFSTSDMHANGSLEHLLPGIVERVNRRLTRRHAPLRHLIRRTPRPYCRVLPYNENFGALRVAGAPLHEIEALFSALVDADSGEPVVTGFSHPSIDNRGAKAATLPDLLIGYRHNILPTAVQSPALGRITASATRHRPGNHAIGGLVIAAGDKAAPALAQVTGLQDLAALARTVLT